MAVRCLDAAGEFSILDSFIGFFAEVEPSKTRYVSLSRSVDRRCGEGDRCHLVILHLERTPRTMAAAAAARRLDILPVPCPAQQCYCCRRRPWSIRCRSSDWKGHPAFLEEIDARGRHRCSHRHRVHTVALPRCHHCSGSTAGPFISGAIQASELGRRAASGYSGACRRCPYSRQVIVVAIIVELASLVAVGGSRFPALLQSTTYSCCGAAGAPRCDWVCASNWRLLPGLFGVKILYGE